MPLARDLSRFSGRLSVVCLASAPFALSLGCSALGIGEPKPFPSHPALDGTWDAQTTITCDQAPTSRAVTIRLVLANDGPSVSAFSGNKIQDYMDGVEEEDRLQKLTGTWQMTRCSGEMGPAVTIRGGRYVQRQTGPAASLNTVNLGVILIELRGDGVGDSMEFQHAFGEFPATKTIMVAQVTRRWNTQPGQLLWESTAEVVFTRQP